MITPLTVASNALNAKGITHKAEEGEFNLTDDSIEVEQTSASGLEISVQVANNETPRGQKDYIVSVYSKTHSAIIEVVETSGIQSMMDTIVRLFNDDSREMAILAQ